MQPLTKPPGWQVRRLKFVSTINDEALPESTPADVRISYVDIGDVTSEGQITGATEYRFEQAPSRARRKVRDGDVIVSTVRTYLRAIAPVHDPEPYLIVSTGFAVVRPTILDTSFAAYALRAPYFVDLVVAASTGVSYPAINASTLGDLPVLVPPLTTQRAIAAFLDRETAKVDALIEKKRRLFDLLGEKRTALITRAVTRGLDPDVPMKDSGVEWLGEIPVHWQATKLKVVANVQTGLTLGKRYDEELVDVPYLRVANVQSGYIDTADLTTIPVPLAVAKRHALRRGDVLMTEGGDFDKLGRGYVWDAPVEPCLHQNHVFAVRPRRESLLPVFLAWLTSSLYGRAYFTATSKQSTNLASTSATKVGNFPIPLPPKPEQTTIEGVLRRELQVLEAMERRLNDAIALLQEYRAALISAAVTGQIDIPGAAA